MNEEDFKVLAKVFGFVVVSETQKETDLLVGQNVLELVTEHRIRVAVPPEKTLEDRKRMYQHLKTCLNMLAEEENHD